MLYLNSQHLKTMGADWPKLVEAVHRSSVALAQKDFAQPIKPYLRYNDPVNRIIAMPAFIGGDFNAAGIKWIASFPKNIDQGIQRAHSVTILNDYQTGKPLTAINSAVISAIRTAAVTGYMIRFDQEVRPRENLVLGMTGFGPIGQHHLDMMRSILKGKIAKLRIFDLRPIDPALLPKDAGFEIEVVDSWQAAFEGADIFTTCTVSKVPYVNLKPKPGSLQLNVSLRDYEPQFMNDVQVMIVDDWDEVCREATDIERMHEKEGLKREDTFWMADVAVNESLRKIGPNDVVMFNPMGMAVFDMAVAMHFYERAQAEGVGVTLED